MASIKKTNIYSYLKSKFSNTASHIKMNGTQSAGSSDLIARADHVHPTDTSRAPSDHDHDGTYIKDATGTVTSTHIKDKTIANGDIADSTIQLGKLNASSVADSTSGGTSGSSKLATSGAVFSGLNALNGSNLKLNSSTTQSIEDSINDLTDSGSTVKNGHKHEKNDITVALIPANADLDGYVTNGYYYCTATNYQSITNGKPPLKGNYNFVLVVDNYSTSVFQLLEVITASNTGIGMYFRAKTGSGWSDWKIISLDGHAHTISEISDFPTTMTPTRHDDENGSTYGLGSATKFGHCKVINNLNQTSHVGGQVLSAYQGKVLSDKIDANKTTVSDSLTDTSTTNALSANKGNVLSDNVAILAFRSSNSIGGGVFTSPDALTMSKNGYLYLSVTNANGNALSGTILIDFNNGANIYSRTLSNGMASLQITSTGTFVLRVFYHKDGSFKGSMIGKVTVS